MASRRLADTPTPARRRQAPPSLPVPPDDSGRTARDLLLNSWPGRLFIVAVIFKILILIARIFGEVPAFLQVLSTAATVALAFSVLFFLTRLVFLVQRRLLWRVRRKLILSYIFIGVVPALLILGFFLLSTGFLAGTVAAYLFRDGYEDVTRQVQLMSEAAALEIGRSPRTTDETVDRVQRNGATSLGYPTLSLTFIPASTSGLAPVSRGPWEHLRGLTQPSALAPTWVQKKNEGFVGTTSVTLPDAPDEPELVIRAIKPAARATAAPVGWVVVDLPLDAAMLNKLYQRTGVKAGLVTLSHTNEDQSVSIVGGQQQTAKRSQSIFANTVTLFDSYDWDTGATLRATMPLSFRLSDLFTRLAKAQSIEFGGIGGNLGSAFRILFVVVAVLFLIIELVALVMGLALARSITSSIHELFMGTERVRMGDFTHRINVTTEDQLGELAGSFNQMTGSIETLLLTAAEK
jgi:sigma-B regulation protein RsbU (phosphoserine phosphatase)